MKISENNIKLLAIRPLKKCDPKYTKTLKEGTVYPLLQNYIFNQNEKGHVFEIESFKGSDLLYNQDIIEEQNGLSINISAIVGQNGSGKSSLVELYYISSYLVGLRTGLITIDESDQYYRSLVEEVDDIVKKLKVEIYYELDNSFFCLRIDSEFVENYQTRNIKVLNILAWDDIVSDKLFYSIAINYSIHGLNQESNGRWLWKIFNKNDGYRTPIVINPYRDWGVIHILSEAHLAQSRLLANSKYHSDGFLGNILTNRSIESVKLNIKIDRLKRMDGISTEEVVKVLENSLEMKRDEIFIRIYQAILDTDEVPKPPEEITFGTYLQIYVLKKTVKISRNYREYRKEFYNELITDERRRKSNIPTFRSIDKYLSILKTDLSHVTLKLRQALNTYRFNMLKEDERANVIKSRYSIKLPIKKFSERVATAQAQYPSRELVEFIPLAMFMPTIKLTDGSNFMSLSSGEQQFIHSMQSVLYHLNNLNSVSIINSEAVTDDSHIQRIRYKHVNVILDEIELYFHPEFQRRYLYELIFNIRSMKLENIKAVNILFLTHSPFILSDIPRTNILKLNKGEIVKQSHNTFAGNIHTMLSDSFFMKSTIGEFASREYSKIIDFYNEVRLANEKNIEKLRLNYIRKRNYYIYLIEIIGEDILKNVLKNNIDFIDRKLNLKNEDDHEIERLLEMRREIDENLKRRGYDQN